uniref:Uncharacterized protein n=1 Tax=Panagrolaimus sp. ES5 TaxID=591445 RepID=A0AC34FHB0_9BILA
MPSLRNKKNNSTNQPKQPKTKLVFTFQNVYQQRFDFPYDMMKHICKENYNVVKKLYFTCKYFPATLRFYLIDTLNSNNIIRFNNAKKKFNSPSLINSLNVKVWVGDGIKSSIYLWMPKIVHSTIKKLEIPTGVILWNDFKILAKAETIEILKIFEIIDSERQNVPLEGICSYLPKLKELR